jgi:hypothetical protein
LSRQDNPRVPHRLLSTPLPSGLSCELELAVRARAVAAYYQATVDALVLVEAELAMAGLPVSESARRTA